MSNMILIVMESNFSFNIDFESLFYSFAIGYLNYSTFALSFKSFFSGDHITLTLIEISSPPCIKGDGLAFLS